MADKPVSEWDLRALWENLRGYYPPSVTIEEVEEEHGAPRSATTLSTSCWRHPRRLRG